MPVDWEIGWSHGNNGISVSVAVVVDLIVLVKFTVLITVTGGEVVVITEVAVLVFVVSIAGATMRLAERMTAAMMTDAATSA